jgi:hypothetical protein
MTIAFSMPTAPRAHREQQDAVERSQVHCRGRPGSRRRVLTDPHRDRPSGPAALLELWKTCGCRSCGMRALEGGGCSRRPRHQKRLPSRGEGARDGVDRVRRARSRYSSMTARISKATGPVGRRASVEAGRRRVSESSAAAGRGSSVGPDKGTSGRSIGSRRQASRALRQARRRGRMRNGLAPSTLVWARERRPARGTVRRRPARALRRPRRAWMYSRPSSAAVLKRRCLGLQRSRAPTRP